MATTPDLLSDFHSNPLRTMRKRGVDSKILGGLKELELARVSGAIIAEAEGAANASGDSYTVHVSGDTVHSVHVTTRGAGATPLGGFGEVEATSVGPRDRKPKGRLTIVGLGIRSAMQTTPEAVDAIRRAKNVLYLVADPVAEEYVRRIRPSAQSLHHHYRKNVPRQRIYEDISKAIIRSLRQSRDLCVVFYGHPGVYVYPSRLAMRTARAGGYEASMLPGISAEDTLFADLGIDLRIGGWQSYEATSFLLNQYTFDVTAPLILWQVGSVGDIEWGSPRQEHRLNTLLKYLQRFYPKNHKVILYDASPYAGVGATVRTVPLSRIVSAQLSGVTTMYIPPAHEPVVNGWMVRALGMK